MRIRITGILLICSTGLHALDIPPALHAKLMRFGKKNSFSLERLSFQQHEAYFHERPHEDMHFKIPNVVYLSPTFQKAMLHELETAPKGTSRLIKVFQKLLQRGSPLDPALEEAIRSFYAQYHIKDRLYLSHKDFSAEGRPATIASALRAHKIIFLGPYVQKRLQRARDQQVSFEPEDEYTLLHEYGHLVQSAANALLQQYTHKIPFAIDAKHAREMAADFYAYMVMRRSVLSQLLAKSQNIWEDYQTQIQRMHYHRRHASRIEDIHSWRHLFLGILSSVRAQLQLSEGDADGKHTTRLQRYHLQKIAQQRHDDRIRYYQLLGYNLHEIEHAWPLKPVLRRIQAEHLLFLYRGYILG